MIRKYFSVFVFLLSIHVSFAQKECDIKTLYEDFLNVGQIAQEGNRSTYVLVVQTDRKSCFSEFSNNNYAFLDYLQINFSNFKSRGKYNVIEDSLELRKAFFQDLRNDSTFNAVMNDLVAKSIDKTKAKDSVTMNKLLNIAVKNFNIIGITEAGNYRAKLCSGNSLVEETEVNRNPFVEAFAFAVIVNDAKSSENSIYKAFIKEMKEVYTLNLGEDTERRLLRAQGAIMMQMRSNQVLQDILINEYEAKKEQMPFVLVK